MIRVQGGEGRPTSSEVPPPRIAVISSQKKSIVIAGYVCYGSFSCGLDVWLTCKSFERMRFSTCICPTGANTGGIRAGRWGFRSTRRQSPLNRVPRRQPPTAAADRTPERTSTVVGLPARRPHRPSARTCWWNCRPTSGGCNGRPGGRHGTRSWTRRRAIGRPCWPITWTRGTWARALRTAAARTAWRRPASDTRAPCRTCRSGRRGRGRCPSATWQRRAPRSGPRRPSAPPGRLSCRRSRRPDTGRPTRCRSATVACRRPTRTCRGKAPSSWVADRTSRPSRQRSSPTRRTVGSPSRFRRRRRRRRRCRSHRLRSSVAAVVSVASAAAACPFSRRAAWSSPAVWDRKSAPLAAASRAARPTWPGRSVRKWRPSGAARTVAGTVARRTSGAATPSADRRASRARSTCARPTWCCRAAAASRYTSAPYDRRHPNGRNCPADRPSCSTSLDGRRARRPWTWRSTRSDNRRSPSAVWPRSAGQPAGRSMRSDNAAPLPRRPPLPVRWTSSGRARPRSNVGKTFPMQRPFPETMSRVANCRPLGIGDI